MRSTSCRRARGQYAWPCPQGTGLLDGGNDATERPRNRESSEAHLTSGNASLDHDQDDLLIRRNSIGWRIQRRNTLGDFATPAYIRHQTR